jgi:hypothetical protein
MTIRRLGCAGHFARMGGVGYAYKVLMWNSLENVCLKDQGDEG